MGILKDDTVDIRTMDLKSVPVLQTNTGHPVIDVSQFDSVEQESFPSVFHVTKDNSGNKAPS